MRGASVRRLLVAALVVAACNGDAPTTAPTARASEPRIVDRAMEPPPRTCPVSGLERETIDPAYGPLIGSPPIWFGPYLDTDQRRAVFSIPDDAPRTELGWRVKFLWVVRSDAGGDITLLGSGPVGRTLLFEVEGASASQNGVLKLPASNDRRFFDFPSYVHFPGAGCFTLTARWPTGAWEFTFAAGR